MRRRCECGVTGEGCVDVVSHEKEVWMIMVYHEKEVWLILVSHEKEVWCG